MKKTLTVVISLLVIVTAVFAIYRFNFRKSMPTEGELNEQIGRASCRERGSPPV